MHTWFSWDDVMSRLLTWMVERFESPRAQTVAQRIHRLAEEYEAFNTSREVSRIYMPVFGLRLDIAAFQLGGVFITTLAESGLGDHWRAELTRPKGAETYLAGALTGDTVTLVHEGRGTPARLAEVAREAAIVALNILRYTVDWEAFHVEGVALDLFGGEPRRMFNQFVVESKGGQQVNFHRWQLGPRTVLVLNEAWHQRAVTWGLNEISEVAASSALTKFQRSLLRAVYWFGNYQTQMTLDNQLLSLATSIESCFGTEMEDKITLTIAEGLALLHGQTPDERINLRNEFKKMYGKRSKLTHGEGSNESITYHDVKRFEFFARATISFLLPRNRQFSTNTAFKQALGDMKLGKILDSTDAQGHQIPSEQ